MAEHISDYFNNLNQRNNEIVKIRGIISELDDKMLNTEKYIDELDNEINKIKQLMEKTISKKEKMYQSRDKCKENLKLYNDDIVKLENDDKQYIDNIIKSGVLSEISFVEFNSILSKYVEVNKHQHFIDIFGPHLHDHLKKIDIKNSQSNLDIDKRQIRKKSKKRSKKRSKSRR